MATKSTIFNQKGTVVMQWTLTTADPTGDPETVAGYRDRCMQVYGDFGSGSVVPRGSLDADSPTYFTIRDAQGNALSFSSADGRQLLQNTLKISPQLQSSTAGSVTVNLILSGPLTG